jgi:hypothetical protein
VFRVSNAIIVAGISICDVIVANLQLGHAPVYGARPTLLCGTVQLLFRCAGILKQPVVIGCAPPVLAVLISIRIIFILLLNIACALR